MTQYEEHSMSRSYAEIANSFALWGEYVDPYGTMSESDFLALSVANKIAIQHHAFGPEPVTSSGDA